MPGLGTLLRDLHRAHRLVRDLREQAERLPQQVSSQKKKLERQENALREAQDSLKKLKVSALEKESALKSKAQQITKYETQINEVSSKKEFDALKLEISHTREACSKLEDEILQAMSEVDERSAALPAIDKAVKEAREEFARFEVSAKEKQTTLANELTLAQARLAEFEKSLPEASRNNYDRMVKSMGADVLSPVRSRTCTACGTEITSQSQTQLKMDKLVICTSCSRILYLPEEGEPAARGD